MRSPTTSDIDHALINATKGEIKAITYPREFATIPWDALDFFGWRDPKIERRGYLVAERGDPGHTQLVAVLLTTQAAGAGTRRKAMCTICRAVDDGSNVALFAARRSGPAGRKGDTVGTYVCAGLDCSAQLRFPTNRAGRTRLADGHESDDERAAAMLGRLDVFLRSV